MRIISKRDRRGSGGSRWGIFLVVPGLLLAGCDDSDDNGGNGGTPEPAVSVSGSTNGMEVGDTQQLSASTANGSDSSYAWSSESESVATVDDSGLVTAGGVGETIIVAQGSDTGAQGQYVIVVTAPGTGPSPSVSIAGANSVELGSTLALTASTQDGTDTSYSWASNDDAVATVDSSGNVTPVAVGETQITATGADTGAVGTHAVVVIDPSAGATPFITVTGNFSIQILEPSQLTATTNNGTDAGYTWASDDENVAQVDDTGLVTGVGPGSASITATGNDSGAVGTIGMVVNIEVPAYDMWIGSGHADREAEAFRHWDEDGEIPENCARCHSTFGYQDYLGADGSEFEVVNQPAALGTVVECTACHNSVTPTLDTVLFPSGVRINNAGAEARCMTCHQGRESTDSVDMSINDANGGAGVGDDEVSADLGFKNVHYYAAGATLFAGQVRGGYQYEGQVYDWRFRHVSGADRCQGCHNPHSLELKFDACETCHDGATTAEAMRDIRQVASRNQDYDGDGNLDEGLFFEIYGTTPNATGTDGLLPILLDVIQRYPGEQNPALGDICYGDGYPYFFKDNNSNGVCDPDEISFPNQYDQWTPRLLRAAYNYQNANRDPGSYAHNGKYVIQLLYDSILDVNSVLGEGGINTNDLVRNDQGHFNGAGEAARHWDDDSEVSSRCSQCHGGSDGFRFFLEFGATADVEQANGLDCEVCHEDLTQDPPTLIVVDSVTLPSGESFTDVFDDDGDGTSSSNMCGTCHQGRTSGVDVEDAIADTSTGTPIVGQRFINVHYKPAYATRVGGDGKLGVEYAGQTYAGVFNHSSVAPGNECAYCHQPQGNNHSFHVSDIAMASCNGCHPGSGADITVIKAARRNGVDYDGDQTVESLPDELAGMAATMFAALQASASASASGPICYADRFPYFFQDTNDNGTCEDDETSRYSDFTPEVLRGSFNYQLSQVEGGAWAHNFDYIGQLLYDSTVDLAGDGQGMVRPGDEDDNG